MGNRGLGACAGLAQPCCMLTSRTICAACPTRFLCRLTLVPCMHLHGTLHATLLTPPACRKNGLCIQKPLEEHPTNFPRVAGTTTTIVPRAQLVPATTAVTPHFLQTLMLLWGFLLWGCRRKECFMGFADIDLSPTFSFFSKCEAVSIKHVWLSWSMDERSLKDAFSSFGEPSPFFTEQLTAFEVWLDHRSENKKPPEQLPIVLQVLLSQGHRFRALVLLGRFLDMGPWAVDLALSVGIFPYVLKLLQTTTPELRQILVFIWTKILALDKVLLSQGHRFRALVLLGRFLDMGPWAVDLALSVGIFPYVLKLLQTTTSELRQILVFIWTKILALDKSASQVHGGLLAAGFFDGSVKLYDARIPELLVCTMRPHVQKVEKVVGIGFQPGLDSSKIVSASQAGDIQFLDIRNQRDRYLTIDAHRGSLTALAVHRHAPILASSSAKQLIKVFSLDGDQLGTIRYHQQACFHCWWNQT
ncbi:regulatory-associated protein of TOR 1-like [Cucumis melo var. makuwa]|uniref:Regulatory-associated protein of TOR 1-like n=1 Tax=Cucumis melo var. makuwa TaxID=1194695 RepID=A0A5A7TH52_CUCMM|nr:regulatory-associated protein of TOR 1-like [Cucumis melo var. makuwa]